MAQSKPVKVELGEPVVKEEPECLEAVSSFSNDGNVEVFVKAEPVWENVMDHFECEETECSNQNVKLEVKPEPVFHPSGQQTEVVAVALKEEHDTQEREGRVFSVTFERDSIKRENYKCATCGEQFEDVTGLTEHTQLHKNGKLYSCDFCDSWFRSKCFLIRHLKFHTGEKQFFCQICEHRFKNKTDLNRHSAVHTDERNFCCDICKEMFKLKSTLKDHVLGHMGVKFPCEVCESRFANKRSLRMHRKYVHGEKKYSCKLCEKRFARKFNLVNHMDTHSEGKPYSCPICKKEFRLKRVLDGHVKTRKEKDVRKRLNQSAVLTTYHAYVTATLRYGVMFWGNATGREMVFRSQKKCLRSVCGIKPTDSCKPHFIDLNILTLPCLYVYEISMYVKLNITQFASFNSKRQQYKINFKPYKTAFLSKSIFGMAPKIFNKLPISILKLENLLEFKNKLFKFLVSKAYYSVQEYLDDALNT